MNQKPLKIALRDFTEDDHPFGNQSGRETFRLLKDYVDSKPNEQVFIISLDDIVATDASFPRESVVALAKQYRGEKGFALSGFNSRDLVDNWNYSAKAKEQPLVIWDNEKFEFIGPELKSISKEIVDYTYKNKSTTTSMVAEKFNLSTPNASAKLKKLSEQGYLLRVEEVAESGGREFIYIAIGKF